MMPERLAHTDPFKVPEIIGSGPFRFVADERVPGARNVYERFAGYKPREGVSDWTSGPKVVHYDRIEWTTMPDAAPAPPPCNRASRTGRKPPRTTCCRCCAATAISRSMCWTRWASPA
jgi:hypothetical protein